MSKTANVPIGETGRKVLTIDVRSVIIVAILAFGAGAVSANQEPSHASTPTTTQPTPAEATANSGK